MKKYLCNTLFILFSSFFTGLQAQSFNFIDAYGTVHGYSTYPARLVPLADGRMLTLSYTSPYPGALFQSTLIATIFDTQLEAIHTQTIALPTSEAYHLYSATGTPDSGFVVSVAMDLCDAITPPGIMIAFNKAGQIKWQIQSPSLPTVLKVAPDNSLIGMSSNDGYIKAYNIATGNLIWSSLVESSGGSFYCADFVFVDGLNTLMATSGSKVFRLDKNPNTQEYKGFVVAPLEFNHLREIRNGPDHSIYTFNESKGRLFKCTQNLNLTQLNDFDFEIQDVLYDGTQLILLAKEANNSALYRLDTNGQNPVLLKTFQKELDGFYMQLTDEKVYLLGINGSGKDYDLYFDANQLWIHSLPLNDPTAPGATADAELDSVIQSFPLSTNSYYSPTYGEIRYKFGGGEFLLNIRNNSNSVLQSVEARVAFDWYALPGLPCLARPALVKRYNNLNLQPGAATQVFFGDISAVEQTSIPSKVCFWLSAPNHLPDSNPADDYTCTPITTVGTDTPDPEQPIVGPNPTGGPLYITSSTPVRSLDLYDATGRRLHLDNRENTAGGVYIDLSGLPAGQYWLRLELGDAVFRTIPVLKV